ACAGAPFFSEMHGAKPNTFMQRVLFARVNGIIAINKIIVAELQHTFPKSRARYAVEPNGVDISSFRMTEKREAREKLGLPQDVPIVLYAGRFFAWKGLEILPQAAALAPTVRWQMVGGDKEQFMNLVQKSLPENMCFAGSRPHSEMAMWFSAADALIVLGTARDVQSYRYTSPMKLFEYLATGRPIVASNTPAIREVVSADEVLFYAPDDAHDLARAAEYAAMHPGETASRTEAAKRRAGTYSWRARAERTVHFVEEASQYHA
ncbi:MAG: group 1 glycosyl transferase, partial [Parcubacteria group bacterium Gr01-1014_49]